MKKTESKKAISDIRNIYANLERVKLYNRVPDTIEMVLRALSYAENFDSGYGMRIRHQWENYKDGGLEREDIFQEFKERVLQLALDIEKYFANDNTISEPEDSYIKLSIIKSLKQADKGFNYRKLLGLISELNSNYLNKNVYSCLMLIRAIIDHTPPLLGFKTFDQVINIYPLSQTDKAYLDTLSATKMILHDALHRTISKSEDLFELSDVPNKMHLNRLLQICLDSEINADQISKANSGQTQKNEKIKKLTPPPIVEVTLQSVGGRPDSYIAEFQLTNKGQELAILKKLDVTDAPSQDLGRFKTLSLNEHLRVSVQLFGSDFRTNSHDAKLSVTYQDIYGNNYKSTYEVLKKKQSEDIYNFEAISNFNFFLI